MKKFFIVTLILLISVIFVPPGFAFSKAPPEKTTPEKAPAPESAPVDERVPVPKQQVTKSKPGVSGFVGTVIMVDANLIDVWGKKAEVTFDASNPKLRGYKTIADVMVGDTVAVAYTKDGIMITKLKGTTRTKALKEKKAEKAKMARPELAPKKAAPKQQVTKSKPGVSGFVGTVIMVDANLIDVWGKKAEVTFDASNPKLRGYKTIADVMVGDTVAVAYTKDGIMITKLKGTTRTKALKEKKAEKAKKASRKATVTQITCSGKGPCTVSVDKREE